MTVLDIQSYIETIENNASLFEENSFDQRMEMIEFIDQNPLPAGSTSDTLVLLQSRVERLQSRLEDIDRRLFRRLRASIRAGGYTGKAFKDLVNEYVDLTPAYGEHREGPGTEETGYDNLDIFINGLSFMQAMPEQTKDLEPDMVYYQKTPARIIFELAERIPLGKEDVFFDLGSGLGQAAILVNILAGIRVRGVEYEPAFCDYARNCAAELNLSRVEFINIDARNADYSEGTIFFMYTPFSGDMLDEVLERLRKEALRRKITILTYGPCTARVAVQDWLYGATPKGSEIYKLMAFSNRRK